MVLYFLMMKEYGADDALDTDEADDVIFCKIIDMLVRWTCLLLCLS